MLDLCLSALAVCGSIVVIGMIFPVKSTTYGINFAYHMCCEYKNIGENLQDITHLNHSCFMISVIFVLRT